MEAPEGAPATYTNYWGYEIDLLYSIGKTLTVRGANNDNFLHSKLYLSGIVMTPRNFCFTAGELNFTYDFSNVEDGKLFQACQILSPLHRPGKWGHIEADATWSGMVAQVLGKAVFN